LVQQCKNQEVPEKKQDFGSLANSALAVCLVKESKGALFVSMFSTNNMINNTKSNTTIKVVVNIDSIKN
jgi:hypothetical protein